MILQDHWCRNTYNEFTLELLDSQVPHLFPQEQHTQAHLLAEAASLQILNTRGEIIVITSLDHKNNSHNKYPIGWI